MRVERVLGERFLARHPADVGLVLRRLPMAEVAAVLAGVEPALAAGVVRRLESGRATEILDALGPDAAASILATQPAHEVAAELRRLTPAAREPFLRALPGAMRDEVQRLVHHRDGTAGALADTTVIALPEDYAVSAARRALRRGAQPADGHLFVVTDGHRLTGAVATTALLAAPPGTRLAAIATRPTAALRAHADRAAIVMHPGWATQPVLPVVDDAGVYLGAIRHAVLRRLETGRDDDAPGGHALAAFVSIAHACVVGMATVLRGLDPDAWRTR